MIVTFNVQEEAQVAHQALRQIKSKLTGRCRAGLHAAVQAMARALLQDRMGRVGRMVGVWGRATLQALVEGAAKETERLAKQLQVVRYRGYGV